MPSRHRTNEDVDSLAIERWKPGRLHDHALSGREKWIEYGERGAVGRRGQGAGDERSETKERRQSRLPLLRQTAPRRHNHGQRNAFRGANQPELDRQLFGRSGHDVDATFENGSGFGARE